MLSAAFLMWVWGRRETGDQCEGTPHIHPHAQESPVPPPTCQQCFQEKNVQIILGRNLFKDLNTRTGMSVTAFRFTESEKVNDATYWST